MASTKPFTIIGAVVFDKENNRKRFQAKSADYLQSCVNRFPDGTELAATFTERKPSRSQSQLNMYWAIVGYISDYTGYTPEETHHWLKCSVFDVNIVEIKGRTFAAPRSIAAHANMPKNEMGELIEFALTTCKDLGIVVPTPEELGYLPH